MSELWTNNTVVTEGMYVYPTNNNGYYYVALNNGTTQSSTFGKTTYFEPVWVVNKTVYDGILIFDFVVLEDSDIYYVWAPKKQFNVGDLVVPTTGPVNWNGKNCGWKLSKIIAEPDWPMVNSAQVVDNGVIWEAKVSAYTFIPKALFDEENSVFTEVYKILDYITQTELDDLIAVVHKFYDRKKLDVDTLKEIINELGYEYIADVFELTKEEVNQLLSYIALIHALKGSREGLKLVMDLMGLSYHIEEWWEKSPTGVVDTFDLSVDINLSNLNRNTLSRLVTFIKNYVYPKLNAFEIKYNATIADLVITAGGFCDETIYSPMHTAASLGVTSAAFIDETIYGSASAVG